MIIHYLVHFFQFLRKISTSYLIIYTSKHRRNTHNNQRGKMGAACTIVKQERFNQGDYVELGYVYTRETGAMGSRSNAPYRTLCWAETDCEDHRDYYTVPNAGSCDGGHTQVGFCSPTYQVNRYTPALMQYDGYLWTDAVCDETLYLTTLNSPNQDDDNYGFLCYLMHENWCTSIDGVINPIPYLTFGDNVSIITGVIIYILMTNLSIILGLLCIKKYAKKRNKTKKIKYGRIINVVTSDVGDTDENEDLK